jgi:hypothetical protein
MREMVGDQMVQFSVDCGGVSCGRVCSNYGWI